MSFTTTDEHNFVCDSFEIKLFSYFKTSDNDFVYKPIFKIVCSLEPCPRPKKIVIRNYLRIPSTEDDFSHVATRTLNFTDKIVFDLDIFSCVHAIIHKLKDTFDDNTDVNRLDLCLHPQTAEKDLIIDCRTWSWNHLEYTSLNKGNNYYNSLVMDFDDEEDYQPNLDFSTIVFNNSCAGYILVHIFKDWCQRIKETYALERVEVEKCPVSLETLSIGSTRLLTCGHMICEEVFVRLLKDSEEGNWLKCPVCRLSNFYEKCKKL
jgi:hypothetical protein